MKRIIGQLAEAQARTYLELQGLTWIDSNYRCPAGEIDLIMRDCSYLVFVEVRYRTDLGYGESVETVESRKQNRLIKAAWHYLLATDAVDKLDCRFDVIGLTADAHHPRVPAGNSPYPVGDRKRERASLLPLHRFYWIQNAFEVKY